MSRKIRIRYSILCLLMVLSGCATSYLPPERDLWAPFNGENRLSPGFGLYTYLLIRDTSTTDPLEEAFIREILCQAEGMAGENTPRREQYNLFALPVGQDARLFRSRYSLLAKEERLPFVINGYNDDHAKQIMGYLSAGTDHSGIKKKLQGKGPFLVSVLKPLNVNSREKLTLLLFDGSTINTALVPHVIKRYCDYIHNNEVEEEKIFHDFSIYLGDLLLDANESLFLFHSIIKDTDTG